MKKQKTGMEQVEYRENVVAGLVGAFLFSLIGGILWFVIYMFGFLAGISGLIGVICAIKGYAIFAKKESTKGVILSSVIALLVMVIAWYMSISYELYDAYQMWFANGEIDFTLTFFESVYAVPYYLFDPEIGMYYWRDLAIGLVLCVIGAASYVYNRIRNIKAEAQAKAVREQREFEIRQAAMEAEAAKILREQAEAAQKMQADAPAEEAAPVEETIPTEEATTEEPAPSEDAEQEETTVS